MVDWLGSWGGEIVVAVEAGLKCLQYRPRGYGLITVPKVGMCTGGGWQLTWFKIEWLGVGADEGVVSLVALGSWADMCEVSPVAVVAGCGVLPGETSGAMT